MVAKNLIIASGAICVFLVFLDVVSITCPAISNIGGSSNGEDHPWGFLSFYFNDGHRECIMAFGERSKTLRVGQQVFVFSCWVTIALISTVASLLVLEVPVLLGKRDYLNGTYITGGFAALTLVAIFCRLCSFGAAFSEANTADRKMSNAFGPMTQIAASVLHIVAAGAAFVGYRSNTDNPVVGVLDSGYYKRIGGDNDSNRV